MIAFDVPPLQTFFYQYSRLFIRRKDDSRISKSLRYFLRLCEIIPEIKVRRQSGCRKHKISKYKCKGIRQRFVDNTWSSVTVKQIYFPGITFSDFIHTLLGLLGIWSEHFFRSPNAVKRIFGIDKQWTNPQILFFMLPCLVYDVSTQLAEFPLFIGLLMCLPLAHCYGGPIMPQTISKMKKKQKSKNN